MAKKDIKILAFTVRAPYAFFRIPYATTGAPSYPFPPRTTVIGLVSAILGIRREELWRKDNEYSALFDPMITGVGVKILNLRGSITSALLYGRIKDEKSESKKSAIPKIRVKNGKLIYEYTQESVVYPTQLLVDPEYRVYITTEEGILEKLYGMIKEKLSYKLEAYDYNTGKTFKASQEPECGVVKFGDVKINEDEGSVEAKVYFNEFLNGERKRFNKKSLNQKLMMIQPLPTKKGEKPKFSKEYFVVSFKGFDNKKYAKTKVKTAMFILTKRIFGTKYKSSDNLDCWDGGGTEKNVIVFPESARAWGTVWSAQGINLAKVFDKFDEECKRVLFEDINVGENLKWVEVTIKIIESTEKGVTRTREE